MKTLIASALLATAALAAPAAAQVASGSAAAIAHFNADFDTQDGVRVLKAGGNGVTVSTRSGGTGVAFGHFNGQADSQDGIRGLNGATAYSGAPSVGGDIFDRIRAESAEGE
ncbi:hypothetical protein [Jannaschia marina]|uniref:hypothetical protein n=1 Tax=Jannaschia marina TaxID=2741674 RepID=UPI0015C8AA57|nr:hypothetical protein [Jannaschia marina]